jgi:hypothetical protein
VAQVALSVVWPLCVSFPSQSEHEWEVAYFTTDEMSVEARPSSLWMMIWFKIRFCSSAHAMVFSRCMCKWKTAKIGPSIRELGGVFRYDPQVTGRSLRLDSELVA